MAVDIRPATTGDLNAVQAVAREGWYAAHASIIGEQQVERFLTEYYDRESLEGRLHGDATFLVADDGAVVGFVVAGPTDDDPETFVLGRLYVLPDRWGEGIGRQLVTRVETRASERGGERIRLGVMAENDRAVAFYEALDYDRIGQREDERIGTTAYEYEKRL